MKKIKNGRLIDIFTGVIVGGLIGLHYPLGEYHLVLVILTVVLGLRFLKVVK